MHIRTTLPALLLTLLATLSAHAADKPDTTFFNPDTLAQTKAALDAGQGPQAALATLKADANEALRFNPVSVMQKPAPGPSGDKHDYVSYAPYFWPNPKTPNGLPYIRKDGYRNHAQVSKGDASRWEPLLDALQTLGLAYYYTGNPAYAQHAATLARTWFINPDTRMNPNFRYAQAVLGVVDGRGIGLIESRALPPALDALTLIPPSAAWTPDDQNSLHQWVADYTHWISTNPQGLDEKAAKNNHGSWYAVQAAGLYLYLHDNDAAHAIFESVKDRIASQIQPDGRQPLEIARTDGFGYSAFNVDALSTLAALAARHNVDLWHYQSPTGASLQKALDYLLPFAFGQQTWKTSQLKPINPTGLIPVLILAAPQFPTAHYENDLHEEPGAASTNRTLLTGIPSYAGQPATHQFHAASTQPTTDPNPE